MRVNGILSFLSLCDVCSTILILLRDCEGEM